MTHRQKWVAAAATSALLTAAAGLGFTTRRAAAQEAPGSQDISGGSAPVTLTEKNDKKAVAVWLDDTLTIRLDSNATTGYSWRVVRIAPSGVLARVGTSEYISDKHPPGMTGVGGTQVFRFKAQASGIAKVRLEYWEPGYRGGDAERHKPARTWEATITVRVASG